MTNEHQWRVGHTGRDQMYYEEQHNGAWHRLVVDGEMLTGIAHHVIYFATAERWMTYPDWARHRRDEIIARIMSEFRAPDYEYDGVNPTSPTSPDVGERAPERPPPSKPVAPPAPVHQGRAPAATPQQTRALLLAIAVVLAIAVGMGWLVVGGVTRGTSNWPSKRPTQMRTVTRAQEPVMYWAAIGVYGTLGLTTLALGLWGVREWATLERGVRARTQR